MPGNPRKKAPSASQAELHSVEKQMRLLTPEMQADLELQQKLGEKWGLAHCSDQDHEIDRLPSRNRPVPGTLSRHG